MSTQIIMERLKNYKCQTTLQEEQALKEIAQEIALAGLSRGGFFKKAAFQDGTCLRILYGLNRFSEDLDFILKTPEKNFKWHPHLNDISTEFSAYGISLEINDRSDSKKTVQCAWIKNDSIGKILQAKFSGGKTQKKINIKLEIDTNPPANSDFQIKTLDFPVAFAILTQDLPSLFAGKLHALLCRKYTKGRDWYDFLWYTYQKSDYNQKFLASALQQIGPWQGLGVNPDRKWFRLEMEKKINETDWRKAKDDVQNFLQPQEALTLTFWNKEFFLERLKNYFLIKYQIHVFCNHCGETHPLPIAVNLDDGPVSKESLNNIYQGKEIPERLIKMVNNTVICPQTGKSFVQQDNDQIFLVVVG